MNRLILTTAFLAAFGVAPASATLQTAAQIGLDSFFCADQTACDNDGALNVLQLPNQTLDGIVISGSIQSALFGALTTGSLDITNTNTAPVTITAAVSATDFSPVSLPDVAFHLSGSGTWQGPGGGSFIDLKWFVDPLNAQGALNAFSTPGILVGSFADTAAGITGAFSDNALRTLALTGPFSMTEQVTIHLAAGESIINRGQALASAPVPETATWVMFVIGAAFIGWGVRRQNKGEPRIAL